MQGRGQRGVGCTAREPVGLSIYVEKRYSLSRDTASWAASVFRKYCLAQVMMTAQGRPFLHPGSLPDSKSLQTSRLQPGTEVKRERVNIRDGEM